MFRNSKLLLCSKKKWGKCPVSISTHLMTGEPKSSNVTIAEGNETTEMPVPIRGLILGVYSGSNRVLDRSQLSPTAQNYNTKKTNGKLLKVLDKFGELPEPGIVKMLHSFEEDKIPNYSALALVGLGSDCGTYDDVGAYGDRNEIIRRSVASACREMSELQITHIDIESCGHAGSAAEGAALGLWRQRDWTAIKGAFENPLLYYYMTENEACDIKGWRNGLQKASAQNLCRELQTTSSKYPTPTAFAQKIVQTLRVSDILVDIKVADWSETVGEGEMVFGFNTRSKSPIFLELIYNGGDYDDKPIVLIGQATTYAQDAKDPEKESNLPSHRDDVTGAAVVLATCTAIYGFRIPMNIRALIPICHCVTECDAMKTGDTVQYNNGNRVELEKDEHKDLLMLVDALQHAQRLDPKYIIDIGTTWAAQRTQQEAVESTIFTNSDDMWSNIKAASVNTGDKVVRSDMNCSTNDDLDQSTYDASLSEENLCKAACILRKFVPRQQWMHIDCSNAVHTSDSELEYLRTGMAGRPTRTLIEFLCQILENGDIANSIATPAK